MTPQQVAQVQASFAKITPNADRAAALQGLGDEFTPVVSTAWAAACGALSQMMIAAADARSSS